MVSAFQCLLACHRTGTWKAAETGWMNMFMPENMLVIDKTTDLAFVVLAKNQFGFLAIPCTMRQVGPPHVLLLVQGRRVLEVDAGRQV